MSIWRRALQMIGSPAANGQISSLSSVLFFRLDARVFVDRTCTELSSAVSQIMEKLGNVHRSSTGDDHRLELPRPRVRVLGTK